MSNRKGIILGLSHLRNAVHLSHLLLREKVGPGDRVVDATCGNGNDTLFLARLVGAGGQVFAFDVQAQALHATRTLLDENDCIEQVRLLHTGHEQLGALVGEPVQAVVFNLGYLPGSDKCCITRPETTVAALEQAQSLLLPGGVIVAVVYPGHSGGSEEAVAVDAWAQSLLPNVFTVWCSRLVNRSSTAPYVIVAEKSSASGSVAVSNLPGEIASTS